jgi:hypothetical protein
MIGADQLVWWVLGALIFIAIVGLLNYLIDYLGANVPGMAPYVWIAKVVLVVGVVLALIGMLLGLAGHPVIRW